MPTTARPLHRHTYAEYVAVEEMSAVRHEYLAGDIFAMAGGTPDQAALAAAVIRLLSAQLPREYRTFTSDLRIRIPEPDVATYPDVAVICGPTRRATDDPIAVVNPVVLVEVTSPSTEDYDRGRKLEHYQHLRSVRAVLIVSHREPRLTLHTREPAGWRASEARSGEALDIPGIPARLAVDDVYRDGLEDATL
jgi:Uma2 family endonuclease